MFKYQNTVLTPLDRNHCLDLMIPVILAGKIKQKDSNIKNVSSHVGNNASGSDLSKSCQIPTKTAIYLNTSSHK